jgi:hypothetical protein
MILGQKFKFVSPKQKFLLVIFPLYFSGLFLNKLTNRLYAGTLRNFQSFI